MEYRFKLDKSQSLPRYKGAIINTLHNNSIVSWFEDDTLVVKAIEGTKTTAQDHFELGKMVGEAIMYEATHGCGEYVELA